MLPFMMPIPVDNGIMSNMPTVTDSLIKAIISGRNGKLTRRNFKASFFV
jgi:hypothetical protein